MGSGNVFGELEGLGDAEPGAPGRRVSAVPGPSLGKGGPELRTPPIPYLTLGAPPASAPLAGA